MMKPTSLQCIILGASFKWCATKNQTKPTKLNKAKQYCAINECPYHLMKLSLAVGLDIQKQKVTAVNACSKATFWKSLI